MTAGPTSFQGRVARFDVRVPPPADGSTRGRLGRLELPHGVVETPQFMPVGTNATVKALHPDDLREVGASIILANTYHLYLRPGPRADRPARRAPPVHGLGRPDPHRQRRLPGRLARRPAGRRRGRGHVPEPPRRLDPSVHAGGRDRRPGGARLGRRGRLRPAGLPVARRARSSRTRPERTHRWAERSLAAHGRPDQALFGIVQGGLEPDLRAESTRFIASLPFDGICIGGLAGDETPVQRGAALDVAVGDLADDPRPRYLMGLGSPADLLDAVHRGVDLFDSVLPARVARNGQLWVPGGRLNLRNPRFLDDPEPVQADCPCLLCRSFSRAYLAHLLRANELLAYRLATCHNLTFTLDFMLRIRTALGSGTFPDELPELALRAGRLSGSEAAEQSA